MRPLRRYLQWCAGLERVFNMLMGPGGLNGPETPAAQVGAEHTMTRHFHLPMVDCCCMYLSLSGMLRMEQPCVMQRATLSRLRPEFVLCVARSSPGYLDMITEPVPLCYLRRKTFLGHPGGRAREASRRARRR